MNPRPKLTRFLSKHEVHRLHRALDGYATGARGRQADIIRLLLLTGCRKSEIKNLRWTEVDGDVLNLTDSKTGPRQVLLSRQARRIIQCQTRGTSAFCLPLTEISGKAAFRGYCPVVFGPQAGGGGGCASP